MTTQKLDIRLRLKFGLVIMNRLAQRVYPAPHPDTLTSISLFRQGEPPPSVGPPSASTDSGSPKSATPPGPPRFVQRSAVNSMTMIELPPVQKIVRALQVEVNQLGSSGNPPTEIPNAAEKGNSSVNDANIDIMGRSLPHLFIFRLMVLGTIRRSVGVPRHGPQCGDRGRCTGYTLVCRCTDGSASDRYG